MRIYLTGFMASGKSVAGALLARRLAVPFVDLDRRIEAAAGRSIPEIFASDGEQEFRRLESTALTATAELDDAVVATGGGAFIQPANRRWIRRHGVSVFLDPPWQLLRDRLVAAGGASRPLFRDPAAAEELWRRRLPAYRRADLVVAVAATEEPAATAERIARSLSTGDGAATAERAGGQSREPLCAT